MGEEEDTEREKKKEQHICVVKIDIKRERKGVRHAETGKERGRVKVKIMRRLKVTLRNRIRMPERF